MARRAERSRRPPHPLEGRRGGACPSRRPPPARAGSSRATQRNQGAVGADVPIGPQPPPHHPGPAVPVGRSMNRPPPGCDSTREKNVFDQNRRMGRKAGIKSPPREVLRNRRFLSQLLGTFVWRQKYLARRRNLPSRPPAKKSSPPERCTNSPHPTRPQTTNRSGGAGREKP